MANYEIARSISMNPTQTEAISQSRFLQLVSGGTVQHATSSVAGAQAIVGISVESSPDSDVAGVDAKQAAAAIPVAVLDGAKIPVEAGDASTNNIAVGSPINADTTGRAKLAATGEIVLGYSLDSYDGSGGQLIGIIATKGPGLDA